MGKTERSEPSDWEAQGSKALLVVIRREKINDIVAILKSMMVRRIVVCVHGNQRGGSTLYKREVKGQ